METIIIDDPEQLSKLLESWIINEDTTLRLTKDTVYKVPGDRFIIAGDGKLTIEGNGAVVQGCGTGCGICIKKSNVTVRNLKIENYFCGIRVEADNTSVKGITIQECSFHNIESEGVSTAIRNSGCTIEDISVKSNYFEAPTHDRNGHCSTAINFMTACYSDNSTPIHHVRLRHVQCIGNRIVKNQDDDTAFMLGITVHGASAYAFYDNGNMVDSPFNEIFDSSEEDIIIEDNIIDGVWDIAIDVLAAFPGKRHCTLSDVSICNNKIKYHNTGINVGTTNVPHNGQIEGCHTEMVYIDGNELIPDIPGPNEPQIGIMLFTIRAESGKIVCRNCSMKNVYVINNKIYGREIGVALEAVHSTQDLPYPSLLENCLLENVAILRNEIMNAALPIRAFASHLEGRVDAFWGFELDPFDENNPFSTRCENAVIRAVTIAHNSLGEFDMAFTLGAAWGCGYSFIKNCVVKDDISIFDNKLDSGRKVFTYEKHIVNEVMFDRAYGANNIVMR